MLKMFYVVQCVHGSRVHKHVWHTLKRAEADKQEMIDAGYANAVINVYEATLKETL